MATKHTSGCLKNAKDDEPIFVLLARDHSAPLMVRVWAAQNKSTLRESKYQEAMQVADDMEAWQTANPEGTKNPD